MLNTNYKRYNFYSFLSSLFSLMSMFQLGIYFATKNSTNAYFFIIIGLTAMLWYIYSSIYFNKTYQLKKNAKKEITKENNNK